jgi:histidinol-phosphate aminotransferase
VVKIPEHISELKSYKPGKPIAEIKEELGLDRVSVLWNNENNFGPSPKAMANMQAALMNSHLYPDPSSIELRTAIAEKEGISVEQVVVGSGSEAILSNIFQAFFHEGDHLLTSEGTFVAVYIWAKSHNVPVVKLSLNEDYGFDVQALINGITEKTKAIYIANPNNPTGSIVTKKEFEVMMAAVPEDVIVIMDEAYFEFAVHNEEYPNSILYNYPNVITLRTFSKAYGIAAIRIGYAMGDPDLIEALSKVRLTFEPSNLGQAAGIGALEDVEYLAKVLSNNREQLATCEKLFDEMDVRYVPSLANFITLVFDEESTVQEYFDRLMREGVFVRPLSAFGLPNCLRITLGTPEEMQHFQKAFRLVHSQLEAVK